MAATLRYGARGDDVKTLQSYLNQYGGYNLAVDGIWGDKTDAAVRSWQQKRGLTVDGVVGESTWGSFTNPDTGDTEPSEPSDPGNTDPGDAPDPMKDVIDLMGNAPTYEPSDDLKNLDGTIADLYGQRPGEYQPSGDVIAAKDKVDWFTNNPYGEFAPGDRTNDAWLTLQGLQDSRPGSYQESQAVKDAMAYLQSVQGSRPGEYQSRYDAQIQSLLNDILNREDFSYDFMADPLYQQYAQRYQQQGQMAMMDTMANAAALTGGYGSSYASTAGQQAYQQNLQALNDIIPELQQAAYQKYVDEGNAMRGNMSILQGLEASDYGMYRDTVSDYYNDLNFAYNAYNDTANRDYTQYRDSVNDYYRDYDNAANMYQMLYNQDWTQYEAGRDQYNLDRETAIDLWKTTADMDREQYQMITDEYYRWLDANLARRDQMADDERYKFDAEYKLWQDMLNGKLTLAEFEEERRRWEAEYQLDLDKFEWQKYQAGLGGGGGNGGSRPSSDDEPDEPRINNATRLKDNGDLDWIKIQGVNGNNILSGTQFEEWVNKGWVKAVTQSDGSITYVYVPASQR